MSVDLLINEVPNRYYHDLESVFLDFIYICCICAGPHGLLRDDQSIFDTHVGLWYGKKGQSSKELGRDKWEVLDSKIEFEEQIVSAFHPYFHPLADLLCELREIAVPPTRSSQGAYRKLKGPEKYGGRSFRASSRKLGNMDTQEDLPLWLKDMKNRDPLAFFKMYKKILEDALNDPNIDPPDEGSTENINGSQQSLPGLQPPLALAASALYKTQQLTIPDDVPVRVADLCSLPSQTQQRSPPNSGKRKSQSLLQNEDSQFDEDESDNDAGCPPSPLQGRWNGSSGLLPFRPSARRSGKLEKIVEDAEVQDDTSIPEVSGNKKRKLE